MRSFAPILRKFRGLFASYLVLGIAATLTSAFSVRLLQGLLDSFTAGALVLPAIGLYGGLLILLCAANYAQVYPEQRLTHGIYLELKVEALRKMRTIDYAAYQRLGTGSLVQRIENGAAAGRGMLFDYWLRLLSELVPSVVVSLTFIALMDWKVMALIAAGYVVVFVVTRLLLRILYRIKERILTGEEAFSQLLVRGFMELVVFRLNRRFGREIQRAEQAADAICANKTRMRMVHESFFTIFALLVALVKVSILLYAFSTRSLSVGEVVAVMAFVDNAYTPIAIFNVLYVQYKLDQVAYARYREVLDAPDTPHLCQGQTAHLTAGRVEFDHVSCRYGGKVIFDNLSLRLECRQVVGLAGESGAGKSSLARQLMGLIRPSSGEIWVDGQRLSTLHLESYYAYLSYTPQEPPVFDGTLRENLVFDAHVPDKTLLEALDVVCLTSLVRRLPQGLDTPIGEKGVLLSGGERQRLALARLLFRPEARLFILDEATSAMDNLTEETVLRRVLARLKGRTVLMIAHRLSTLRNADVIYLLKDGVLQGQGDYDALARTDAYFQALLAAQQ